MNISNLIDLANGSGGTLYVMLLLLLLGLMVSIERSLYLASMEKGGAALIGMLKKDGGQNQRLALSAKQAQLPHARLFDVQESEAANASRDSFGGCLEEAIMHEVPLLDRSMWVLDTVITLAPLVGLFGTIIGMFNAFHVLGDVQSGAAQVTGGIAEALIATASGLLIAIIGLVFFNALHQRVRLIMHQLETIKIMLLNRRERMQAEARVVLSAVEPIRSQARV